MTIKLKYVGNGKHITGVPARDLTKTDIDQLLGRMFINETDAIKALTKTGLYCTVKSTTKPPKKETSEDDE